MGQLLAVAVAPLGDRLGPHAGQLRLARGDVERRRIGRIVRDNQHPEWVVAGLALQDLLFDFPGGSVQNVRQRGGDAVLLTVGHIGGDQDHAPGGRVLDQQGPLAVED